MQSARPHWWLSHQRPVRVGLHCQARRDYHRWRQCSLYGLNLQLDNGVGSSHSCPPLDCPKRWQSNHTGHPPHRFNKREAQTGICRWWTSTFENSCGVYCPGHARVKGNDRADRLATLTSGLLNFSADLKCLEAWDTTCWHKAKDITPSIARRREAWKEEALDDLPWKDERGPSSIRRTLEPFQRQR